MVTRKDVAKRANVSVTAVSRALNNSGYVAKDKKAAIFKAAEELGYCPNPIALSLQKKRSRQLLYCCKDLSNEFYMNLYRGMVKEAEKHDYTVVMITTSQYERIKDMLIDGVMIANENLAEDYMNLVGKNYNLPVVYADFGDMKSFSKSVLRADTDLYQAVEMAISYLRSLGHVKIAYAGPYDIHSPSSRHFAYLKEMKPVFSKDLDQYLFCKDFLLKEEGKGLEEEKFYEKGEMAAAQFVKSCCDATAVLCFNDSFAFGFCNEFLKHNGNIPNDLSVMGIDAVSNYQRTNPVLSSIDTNPFMQGQNCVKLLIDAIEDKKEKYVLHTKLTIFKGETVKRI